MMRCSPPHFQEKPDLMLGYTYPDAKKSHSMMRCSPPLFQEKLDLMPRYTHPDAEKNQTSK
jgi:hypothetical protein